MARINAGYKIIMSVPVDNNNELVVGHAVNPQRPAQFVVWDCKNKDGYSNGGYTMTYRQALAIVAERINKNYDDLAVEAPVKDEYVEKAELLVPLFARQMSHGDLDEPPVEIQTAVQAVTESLYCDLKFDHDLLIRWFELNGITEKDRNYFGISMMFDESEE